VADQSRIQSFRTAPNAAESRLNGHRGNGHGPPHGNGQHGHFDPHEASTGQLVTQAANQISTLVRTELALGKAELVERGRKLGVGGGLLAAAGLFSLYALGLLVALYVVVLDRAWPLWLAVLVALLTVGTLTLALAGFGVRRLRAGASVPNQAANSVRDDIASVKHAFHEGRNSR
jgi:Putative Actinobacterial Holin-X, holin superfamily III